MTGFCHSYSYSVFQRILPRYFIWLLLTFLYIGPSDAQQIFTTTSPTLSVPQGVAVDGSGNVYISDTGRKRVVKLNAAGVQQQVFTTTSPALSNSQGIALDNSGDVYIADATNNRIVKLDAAGTQQQIFSTTSPSLSNPTNVAVDSSGNVYVSDAGNSRVIKLDASSTLQQSFQTTSPSLSNAHGVTVDTAAGGTNIYVADTNNNRIVKFNAAGVQQQVFTTTSPALNTPIDVVVDSSGNVYIADYGNNRIVKLDAAGVQQQVFTTTSPSLNHPFSVAVDSSGNVYTADQGNARVVKFSASSSITGDPQFVGFQGQHFQFHGVPDGYFNLVSAPNFFINSHFVYLSTGTGEIYNDTEPFSHPGTYIDQLSFVMEGVEIELHVGPHRSGFTRASLNGKSILREKRITLPLSGDSYIHVHNRRMITVSLGIITVSVTNSDHFFNINAHLNDRGIRKYGAKRILIRGSDEESGLYPNIAQLHGLLGQTWRNIEYSHKRVYRGEPDDYLVGHLFDSNFAYSLFEEKF